MKPQTLPLPFIFILFLFDAPLSTTNTDIHWNNYDLLLKMILLLLYWYYCLCPLELTVLLFFRIDEYELWTFRWDFSKHAQADEKLPVDFSSTSSLLFNTQEVCRSFQSLHAQEPRRAELRVSAAIQPDSDAAAAAAGQFYSLHLSTSTFTNENAQCWIQLQRSRVVCRACHRGHRRFASGSYPWGHLRKGRLGRVTHRWWGGTGHKLEVHPFRVSTSELFLKLVCQVSVSRLTRSGFYGRAFEMEARPGPPVSRGCFCGAMSVDVLLCSH